MPMSIRLVRTALTTAALVALAQPNVVMPAEAASGTAPVTHPAVHGPTHRVSYRGVALQVPTAWPVVDLRANPHACVRLDENAVYVGEPGSQQDCPAHVVGHADTIWMHGSDGAGAGLPSSRPAKVGALAARVGTDPTGHDTTVQFSHQGVQVETSWASDSRTVESALSTATASSTPAAPSSSPVTPSPAPAALSSARSTLDVSDAALVSATPTGGSTYTGMGFDTCAAPTASTMRSWLSSPYRSVGVYIGGSMRACPDGNLNASWVNTVTSMGWGLQPIYVGPQAPCVYQSGLATITASQAAAQGTANADDAIAKAQNFGMGAGTPIYYDMEAYNT
ncbi:MAG TPA: glycoside hydrolase domain-containing protein, partial [Pedococcus sp.]|nr:glycoside hydrolase domain-containing protein [Pedococcus sp.]